MIKNLHNQPQLVKLLAVISMLMVMVGIILLVSLSRHTPYQSPPISFDQAEKPITAMVMPHHDLLLNLFPSFYAAVPLAQRQSITKVILLSPNHFQPESLVLKTSSQTFKLSPNSQVTISSELLQSLNQIGVVTDNEVFKTEHGVMLHLPFIAQNFPMAEVTPILITRNITQTTLNELIKTLTPELSTQGTLLLVSTDFSHYLQYDTAEKNDQTTLKLLQEGDTEAVLRLNDDYLDCSGCMYVLLKLMAEKKLAGPSILFHGNSAQFLSQQQNRSTTSYFVMKW